jgi:hypothetical protein
MRISFLTPRLPPAVCGVGDHTALLAAAIREEGVDVGFVYCKTQPEVCDLPPGPVDNIDCGNSTLTSCIARQNPDWLWVQLSGYGYSRWGAPYALGCELQKLQRQRPNLRLAICLHETHCKPSQLGLKGMILSPWQKHTVGKIARLGDLVFTTNPVWEQWALDDYDVDPARLFRLPIGSNIPQVILSPDQRVSLRERFGWKAEDFIALAFGSYGSQERALRVFGKLVSEGFELKCLDRLVCLGGNTVEPPAMLKSLASQCAVPGSYNLFGNRVAREVGEIMACCDLGLCATPLGVLEKSGAFSAFAQAGLAVIANHSPTEPAADPKQFPVFSASTWDWKQARSSRVKELRRVLSEYANENYKWTAIARRALRQMGSPSVCSSHLGC